ncbi:S8 family serine peptidase [Pelomonas sp. UHG3]|uniref:S8 family serine peptidase n=1 Tax=Roseateles hydrophilus TaxID=2975054 RepID=A0ACC6C538_9BURK|nr:S8 family peptidase [Pelomonas sp. UHG3]MCY4743512.1 S8 family serine peptidase [Pelomonas sp. UHG3]
MRFVVANKKSLIALACGLLSMGAVQAGVSNVQVDVGLASAVQRAAPTTDRLIVGYRDAAEADTADARVLRARSVDATALSSRLGSVNARLSQRGAQARLLRQTGTGAHVFKLDRALATADLERLAAELKAADPNIAYAEPDRKMYPLLTPNDTSYTSQWDLFETTGGIRAPAAWDLATGTGVVVAVIDTGIRPHADLSGQIVAGYDMINDTAVANDGNGRDADASDPGDWTATNECAAGDPASGSSWHGTHVAGTIAAKTNNASGIAGIAFNAKIQPIRVLGKCGGYTSDIADGMIWASGGTVAGLPANATPAKVLNLSLGGGGACDTTSQNAINSARSRGAVVVVAAGNENQNASNSSPANCSGVITVAATDRNGARAYYSNYGTVVTLAAPGGDVRSSSSNGILSTLNAGTQAPGADNYAYYQGTSMAAPHVAGVAALMLSVKPTATPDQIKAALQSSARAFPGTCSGCGSGILNAQAAVQAITGTTTPPTGTVNETESNNTRATANTVSAPATVNGSIGSTSDTDYFKVTLPAGKSLSAALTMGSTSADFDLYVRNSSGTILARSEKGAGQVDSVTYANGGSSAVTLYVHVQRYSGTGAYTLKLQW